MKKIDTRDMTPYEICKFLLDKKGPRSEVSKEIGKSKAYVSIMRKIARDATATLLNAWRDGHLPFDLVRLVIAKDKRGQMAIVRRYLEMSKGRNRKAKGEARATLLASLGEDNA